MDTHSAIEKAKSFLATQIDYPSAAFHPVDKPFVTLSRECGTGGGEFAAELAARLNGQCADAVPGWTVFDRDLVTRMLTDNHLSASLARFLPEDRISEVQAAVGEIVGLHPSLWTMVHQTNRLMRRLAAAGHVILVGRGANFATAGANHGLHVRLIAPLEQRAHHLCTRLGLTPEAALAHLRKTDRARRDYVRAIFSAAVDDPASYDLIVNLEHCSAEGAAELVATVLHSRGWISAAQPVANAV